MTREEASRWRTAIMLSVCLHAALLLFVVFLPERAADEPRILNVRLVVRRGDSGGDGGSAQSQPSQPAKGLGQRKTREVEKKTTKPAPIKPKAVAQPIKKSETKPKAEARAFAETKTVTAPTPADDAPPTPFSGAGAVAKAPTGSDEGVGYGKGNGEGLGVGTGKGAGDSGTSGIADLSSLEVLKKVIPEYPLFSRKRREEGTSVIIAKVENGSVVAALVESSSGHGRLDESALRAIKGWRFNVSGTIRVRIPFVFSLKK